MIENSEPTNDDKEPVYDKPEFDVEETGEETQPLPLSYGGFLGDIRHLKPIMDALLRMKEIETQNFIARWLTILFVVWTTVGLGFYIHTQNPWILVTDAGPGALLASVIRYYFQQKKQGKPDD